MPVAEQVQNPDIVLWAIYDLGGADEFVDVEDAFYKAFEIAPERLAWRTRKVPDFKKCSEALNRAERREPKLLVKNGPDFRKLSAEGQRWIEDNFDWLAEALGRSTAVKPPRVRRSSQLVSRAQRSTALKSWHETAQLPSEKWIMADMLNCSPDSSVTVWIRRLEEMRSAAYAAGDTALMEFLDLVKDQRSGWFTNG